MRRDPGLREAEALAEEIEVDVSIYGEGRATTLTPALKGWVGVSWRFARGL
jgi:hypothetical protein